MATTLSFKAGTIELRGDVDRALLPSSCAWDPRTECMRAEASAYADVVRALVRGKVPYTDEARRYEDTALAPLVIRQPRPFQDEALAAWLQKGGRGVVVLPTGAGKSQVALAAMAEKQRATLVVAPTLDLVRQWYDLLRLTFGIEVGVLGGGSHDIKNVTVSTYDSAWMAMEHMGAKFGLVVFDEVHHLPSASYAFAARMCIAPFRLGLTATPERSDGLDDTLDQLVGPVVYRKDVDELKGVWLADYDVVRVDVSLAPDERAEYDLARATFTGFIRQQGIRLGGPDGWSTFLVRAARSDDGRAALRAHRRAREIAFSTPLKLAVVEDILRRHRAERSLLFCDDNKTAYALSKLFLVPAITHKTKVKERSALLARFNDGRLPVLATSRVLNEGVDVPEASVAVVLSGTGSVREHVQRLGRVLRMQGDKRATLYEVVTADTVEARTSDRRREHVAYR